MFITSIAYLDLSGPLAYWYTGRLAICLCSFSCRGSFELFVLSCFWYCFHLVAWVFVGSPAFPLYALEKNRMLRRCLFFVGHLPFSFGVQRSGGRVEGWQERPEEEEEKRKEGQRLGLAGSRGACSLSFGSSV